MDNEAARINRNQEAIVTDWLDAKKLEEAAKEARLAFEEEFLALTPAKEEGSSTHNLNGYKVTLKGVINRKVDWHLYDDIVASLLAEDNTFVAPHRMKPELEVAGLTFYKTEQPAVYQRLAKAITATPGKVGFTVVRTE